MQLTCRFYKNAFPETEDLVMVNVTQIEEMGVYVNLLEYNNRQGMILMTELSRRRIRSINKLIRVGRNEAVVVVRVDPNKGYIDLSKRRVSPEDLSKCEEKFVRGKTVNSILRHTAEVLGLQTNDEFEELYDKTAWFLDEKHGRPGAAYDVFVRAVGNEQELDKCQVDENTKKILLNNIRRRLAPQAVKCRSDVEVACYGYEGIDAVKAALREGLSASTEEMPVKINLIAPPLYVVTTTCLDGNEGISALYKVVKKIEEGIERYRGIFKLKMEPKVVTHKDEQELQDLMLEKELETMPRPGDDTDSSNEGEDGGIRGRLPGEEDDEASSTVATTSSPSQRTDKNAHDKDNDEDDDDEAADGDE